MGVRLLPALVPPLAQPEQRAPPRRARLPRPATAARHPRARPLPRRIRVQAHPQPDVDVPHRAQGEERLHRVQGEQRPDLRDRVVFRRHEDRWGRGQWWSGADLGLFGSEWWTSHQPRLWERVDRSSGEEAEDGWGKQDAMLVLILDT